MHHRESTRNKWMKNLEQNSDLSPQALRDTQVPIFHGSHGIDYDRDRIPSSGPNGDPPQGDNGGDGNPPQGPRPDNRGEATIQSMGQGNSHPSKPRTPRQLQLHDDQVDQRTIQWGAQMSQQQTRPQREESTQERAHRLYGKKGGGLDPLKLVRNWQHIKNKVTTNNAKPPPAPAPVHADGGRDTPVDLLGDDDTDEEDFVTPTDSCKPGDLKKHKDDKDENEDQDPSPDDKNPGPTIPPAAGGTDTARKDKDAKTTGDNKTEEATVVKTKTLVAPSVITSLFGSPTKAKPSHRGPKSPSPSKAFHFSDKPSRVESSLKVQRAGGSFPDDVRGFLYSNLVGDSTQELVYASTDGGTRTVEAQKLLAEHFSSSPFKAPNTILGLAYCKTQNFGGPIDSDSDGDEAVGNLYIGNSETDDDDNWSIQSAFGSPRVETHYATSRYEDGGGPPSGWPHGPGPDGHVPGVDRAAGGGWRDVAVTLHFRGLLDGMGDPPTMPMEEDRRIRPFARYLPHPHGVETPEYYQLVLNRCHFHVKSALIPASIVDNGRYSRVRSGMLSQQRSLFRTMVAIYGVQIALGPNGMISPSTESISSLLVSSSPETRDKGMVARAFVAIACNQFNLQGATYKEIVDLSIGRAIHRFRAKMKKAGIWGPAFLLLHPRPRNTRGIYLDHYLALDEMLDSSQFKDYLEIANEAKVRLSEAEYCRVTTNACFHDMSGFGHTGVGGHTA